MVRTSRAWGFALASAAASLFAHAPSQAVSCGGFSVGDFAVRCTVLFEDTRAFRMRIATTGPLPADGFTAMFLHHGIWWSSIVSVFHFASRPNEVEVIGNGRHIAPPHGEGLGPIFVFGPATLKPATLAGLTEEYEDILPHGAHFDDWRARHTLYSRGYRFFLRGDHHPVPEPLVWAQFLFGFACVGVAARRRAGLRAGLRDG